MEFKVIAPGGNEIIIVNDLPATLKNSSLVFDNTIMGKAAFGEMTFRNYKGEGFEIWYSNYFINHTTEIIGRAEIKVLELHIQFQNHFNIDWDGVGKNELTPFQFNLSYTPFVNNWAKFLGGKEYYTFDIHFTKEYLARLAPGFKKLSHFLEKIEKGIPSNLSAIDHFLTPTMIAIVQDILKCSFKNEVAKLFIESKVMELLILALERLSGSDEKVPIKLSTYDIERLQEAKQIILNDFENKISLMQLSRMIGINDFKLKKGFKYLFGTTVMDYRIKAKMERAKHQLIETNIPIEDIGIGLGYDFVSNFTSSFKKHFGFPPGYLRKK